MGFHQFVYQMMGTGNFQPHSIVAVLGGAVVVVLVWLMVQPSRLWYSARYAWPLLTGLALIGVGALFKIEHWASSDAQLIIGSLLAVGTYSLWFKAKQVKSLLSFLKVTFVLSFGISLLTLVFWPPWVKSIASVQNLIFWAMALLFVYQRWVIRTPRTME